MMIFSEMAGGHGENSGPGQSEAAEGGRDQRGGELDREAPLKL